MYAAKEQVCIVSGYFNPLTIGHISLLNAAAEYGQLIVIVNNDDQVRLKGSVPFMPDLERMQIVNNIKPVYCAMMSESKDRTICKELRLIRSLYPANGYDLYFANGGDVEEGDFHENSVCEDLGIKQIFNIGGGKTQSSSLLIKNSYDWIRRHENNI